MVDFFSETKAVPYSDTDVFQVLSDLRHLEYLKEKISGSNVKNFTYDKDSCSVAVDPVGNVKFNIVDRNPNSKIKFEAEQVPFALNLLIEMEQASENETRLKVVVNADLNIFLKPMVSKPLQQAVDKMIEMLSSIPYSEIIKKNQ